MNEEQYQLFLSVGAAVSAVGALFNLLLLKRRGASAIVLSTAFLLLAGIFWMMKLKLPSLYVSVAGLLLAVMLVLDFALRSRRQEPPR